MWQRWNQTTNLFEVSNDNGGSWAPLTISQIAFPAVQNPSADKNTLDDYEEDIWTPSIGGSVSESGQAYATQSGSYVKTGRKVWVGGVIVLTNKGTITGNVQIKGLPFAVGSSVGDKGMFTFYWEAMTTPITYLTAGSELGLTVATLYAATAATTGLSVLAQADVSNALGLVFSTTYRAAG